MRMSLLAAVPVVALLVLGSAACEDTSGSAAAPGAGAPAAGAPAAGSPASSSSVDLCTILTADLAKQLIGQDAVPDDQTPMKCSYRADSTGSSVSTQYYPDSTGSQYDVSHGLGNASLKQDVQGVGDKAFYRNDLSTLYARKNGTDLTVQLVTQDTIRDPQAALGPDTTLAQQIVAKF